MTQEFNATARQLYDRIADKTPSSSTRSPSEQGDRKSHTFRIANGGELQQVATRDRVTSGGERVWAEENEIFGRLRTANRSSASAY